MSVNPIFDASDAIKVHTLAASFALALGPIVFTPKQRGKLHKTLGYIWIVALVTTALSSFFIHSFGVIWIFSPIHILSVLTLWGVYRALRFIYEGNIRAHSQTMQALYWYGVMTAGVFTLLPGRVLNRSLFGDAPWLGYVVIACGGLLILRQIWRDVLNLSR